MTKKKHDYKDRKKVSRREFLKKMGLFAVSGVALSKLDTLLTNILRQAGEIEPESTVCYNYKSCDVFQCIAPTTPFQCNVTFVCEVNFYCPQSSRFICVNTVRCSQKFVCNYECQADYVPGD
jgi:hypothetical protein